MNVNRTKQANGLKRTSRKRRLALCNRPAENRNSPISTLPSCRHAVTKIIGVETFVINSAEDAMRYASAFWEESV